MSRTWQIVIACIVAFALASICCVTGYFLVRTLTGGEADATPTAEPAVDDSWERVQAAGKIVVGTSADYPPFEYLVNDTQIDGFDIALMDEIGNRLGVQVEYRNMAFDGLGGALQVGQVDAAIAAISISPERQSQSDFTSVYLVGQDGVLAGQDSGIGPIQSVQDMAGYRIGVQRGSVYESWLQTSLVDSGLMPSGNLLSYETADETVRALLEQRVELVVMDLQPAGAAVEAGGVELVGKGMNTNNYAIAVPKGAETLRVELDRTLAELQDDGTVAQLAKLYLDLDLGHLLPTPTPGATSTPGPEPACVDALKLLGHPGQDGDPITNPPTMNPGQPFTKVWRVKNTGTCTWNSSYMVVYSNGNVPAAEMGGKSVPVQGSVAPGQEYDIAVDLVTPMEAGTYVGYWQMENGKGDPFGERLPVAVTVVPAATAVPTQTPSPEVYFTVDRTQITAGECVVFGWKVENVKAVYFYAEGERWQDNGVAGESSQQECPPVTTTYYLRVVKLDDSVETQQITIDVKPVEEAPVINRFEVHPPGPITVGDCVDIIWDVSGAVDRVTLTASDAILWDNAPLRGKTQDCPAGPGRVDYGIEAVGPGGTSRQQQAVDVEGEPTATVEPTPAPEAPVIDRFTVEPEQIQAGECVDITWRTSGGTTRVTIVKNEDPIWDKAPLRGTTQDCPIEPGSVSYGIVAYNEEDDSVKDELTVTVGEE